MRQHYPDIKIRQRLCKKTSDQYLLWILMQIHSCRSPVVDFIRGKTAWKLCLVKRKTHLSVTFPNSHLSSWSCLTQVTILVQQHKPDIFYWCSASFFRICLMTLLRPVVFIQRALHLLCGVTFKIQSCQHKPHVLHRWLETPLSLPVFRVGMGVGRE